ncbi:hypothetical protein B0T26DRAFT_255697 [Lasiosphaeria miniovina]|uniref:Ketoreductase domain-containing protein n=1 Tax=Lasiosphaeria miniovina TaxID=1954250 RepID=A0AA40AWI1_9PEZI|nr:uncharacterized protein B0T26DRAFT_255697 [Lasiosphaeria miniovina]KAK0723226.1 hypothetical protein B0T26DRAFT_255697 [Lasiosphaeria miniovina]
MALPSPVKTSHFEPYPELDPKLPQHSTKSKHVLITGGGSGFGSAITDSFAQSGAANISILGRKESVLLAKKKTTEAQYPGTKVHVLVADLADKLSVDKVVAETVKSAGNIDILVANAAYLSDVKPFMENDLDDWYKGFDINVKGNFNLIRAFVPHAALGATVVEVSTVVQFNTVPGYSGYHASKLAQHKLFNYLHDEYPALHVVSMHPGAMKTDMTAKLPAEPPFPYTNTALSANFIVWLASPEAKFLDGKLVWSLWDITELKALAKEIEGSSRFTIGMIGWP